MPSGHRPGGVWLCFYATARTFLSEVALVVDDFDSPWIYSLAFCSIAVSIFPNANPTAKAHRGSIVLRSCFRAERGADRVLVLKKQRTL